MKKFLTILVLFCAAWITAQAQTYPKIASVPYGAFTTNDREVVVEFANNISNPNRNRFTVRSGVSGGNTRSIQNVSANGNRLTISFNNSNRLTNNTIYRVIIEPGALNGYSNSGNTELVFMVSSSFASSSFMPASGAADVALNATISGRFGTSSSYWSGDELNFGNVADGNYSITPSITGVDATINTTTSGGGLFSPYTYTYTLNIAYTGSLEPGTTYTVKTTQLSANYPVPMEWSFTTMDPPQKAELEIPALASGLVAPVVTSTGSSIVVKFDRRVPSTYNSFNSVVFQTLSGGSAGVNISSRTLSGDRTTLTLTHAGLADNTVYRVYVPQGAVGNASAFTLPFAVVTGPIAVNPAPGAVDAPTDAKPSIDFGFSAGTVTPANYSITPAAGELSVTAAGNTVNITPASDLQPDTDYEVNITSVSDVIGIPVSWTFKTVPEVKILNGTQTPVGTSEPVDVEVSADFDSPIVLGAVANTVSIAAAGEASVAVTPTVNDTKLVIGHAALAAGTEYTVTIPAHAVRNLLQPFSWTFTTAGPTGAAISDETNVPATLPLEVSFDQLVGAGANIAGVTLTDEDAGGDVEVTAEVVAGVLTVTPAADGEFVAGTDYTVHIPANAVKGQTEGIDLTFTTAAPTVATYLPELDGFYDTENTALTVTFNELIAATVDLSGITVKKGDEVLNGATAHIEGRQLIIEHGGLEKGVVYDVSIPAGTVRGYGDATAWQFTSIMPEPTYPSAEGIRRKASVALVFEAPVTGSFENIMFVPAAGAEIAGTATFDAENNTLTISHVDNFAYNTDYTLSIPMESVTGLTEAISWPFKTFAGPSVTSISHKDDEIIAEERFDEAVLMEFDDEIEIITPEAITITPAGGDNIAESVAVGGSENQLSITHSALVKGTTYTVGIAADAVLGFGGGSWNFTSIAWLPKPLAVTTGVSLTDAVKIQFDGPVVAGSNIGLVEIYTDGGGSRVNVSGISATVAGDELTIVHDRFAKGTTYTVSVPSGAINGQVAAFTRQFTTEELKVTGRMPAIGDNYIEVQPSVYVEFDENISGSYEDITVNDRTLAEYDIEGTGYTVMENRLTLDRNIFKTYGIDYKIVIPASAINGLLNPVEWTFTTKAPVFTRREPTPGGTGVRVNAPVEVTFSANIEEGDNIGNITFDPYVENILATVSDNKLIIHHDDFASVTEYTVSIPEGAVKGLNEEAAVAISRNWKFTTLYPTPGEKTPVEGSFGVPLDTEIKVVFNQAVTLAESYNISITPADGAAQPLTARIEDNTTLRIDNPGLISGKTYTVRIAEGSVIGISGEIMWIFTTRAPGIVFVSVEPIEGEYHTEALIDEDIVIRYDAEITQGPSFGMDNVSIEPRTAGITAVEFGEDKKSLIIKHNLLEIDRIYEVIVNADVINGYTEPKRWTFKTDRLKVVSRTPDIAASDVEVNAPLFVEFNAVPVVIGSGSSIIVQPPAGNVSTSIDGKKLNINHDNFATGTTYTVTIPEGIIKDYRGPISWSFTTVKPVETGRLPLGQATGVTLNADVKITFDRDIYENEDNLSGIRMEPNPGTFTPRIIGSELVMDHADFLPGTVYTVTVPANTVSGIDEELTWSFTTASIEVSSTSPVDNAANVDLKAPIKVTFRANTELVNVSGISFSPEVAGISALVNNNELTISHAGFVAGTQYTVTVAAGTVAGLSEDKVWKFTTQQLMVTGWTPAANAKDILLDAAVSLEFNLDIAKSGNSSVITFSPAVNNVVSSVENRKLTIGHGTFAAGTTYTVTVPANTLTGQHEAISWSFTTIADVASGISEIGKLEISLYPNPVKAGSEFTIQTGETGALIIELYNSAGVLLHKTRTGDSLITMTAPGEQGIYMLRIISSSNAGTYRLVVQ